MSGLPTVLSRTFVAFFESGKSGGILLLMCTVISMGLANSAIGGAYLSFWQIQLLGLTLEHWVNDALMAVFFLLIGLELEREIYSGELSNFKSALLPMVAAVGGMAAPALIHYAFNAGTATQAGVGIPMATDIAFALGVMAILGSRVPASLKVFVVAFAVIDDLGAIVVIALFYTAKVQAAYLAGALLVWAALFVLSRRRVMHLLPYLAGGVLMWVLMRKSGIHATIAGVLLAFAIPYSAKDEDSASPSHRLEHLLHKPVAFLILPVFALANTGIVIADGWAHQLWSANSIGIAVGLVLGKPLGVMLMCGLAVALGWCHLPPGVNWRHMTGAGLLGGIGFTMSIFITNLAFANDPAMITSSKIAILLASLVAALLGYLCLRLRL